LTTACGAPGNCLGHRGGGSSEGRRRVVEVAAAFGLPLPTLASFAAAALAGAFDLGRGPLEAGADLVGFEFGDRALVALGVSQLRWRRRPVTMIRSPLGARVGRWSGRPLPTPQAPSTNTQDPVTLATVGFRLVPSNSSGSWSA
jgi:hypothetical protein